MQLCRKSAEKALKNVTFYQGGRASESFRLLNAAKSCLTRACNQAACIPINFWVTTRHAKDTLHHPKYRKIIGITRNARAASHPTFFCNHAKGHKISPSG
jgi:hypothetical protein